MTQLLSSSEKQYLLKLARETISNGVSHQKSPELDESDLTPALKEKGACFVTLTIDGELRGCIGSLEAYQSLVEDVRAHALHAAFQDYRFPPLTAAELPGVRIEISRLTPAEVLHYSKPLELPVLLTPGVDGVILQDGSRRATFLPQVWKQLPEPEDFLSHLCTKMGAPSALWQTKLLEVSLYKVEEFEEELPPV